MARIASGHSLGANMRRQRGVAVPVQKGSVGAGEQAHQLEAVLQGGPQPIILSDRAGVIQPRNPATVYDVLKYALDRGSLVTLLELSRRSAAVELSAS